MPRNRLIGGWFRLWSSEVGSSRAERALAPVSEEAATRFVLRLGRALHAYGTPSHRLEQALASVASRLGLQAQFLVTPTSILGAFGELDEQRTRLLRVDAGETNLAKLTDLHRVIRQVWEGHLEIDAATAEVERIVGQRAGATALPTILAYGFVSAAAARMFDGGLAEVAASGAIGLIIGLLLLSAEAHPRIARLAPALCALLASLLAAVASHVQPLFAAIVTLASLIVLLPGLTLTTALNELASGHLVSGTARLTNALTIFLQLGFGAALGARLAESFAGDVALAPTALPEWSVLVALVVSASALAVLFRARARDLATILPMIAISYTGARLGSEWLGPELGVALGALLLGVAANAVSRWRDQPTAIALLPALLILVPGSLGFRSLQALLQNDVLSGVESAFTMAMIAVALVTGLLVANVVVVPRRLL